MRRETHTPGWKTRSKTALILAFAVLASPAVLVAPVEAQMVVTGGLSAVPTSPKSVTFDRTADRVRCRRRERNPYFVARPVYPPAERGARANITFAPFTSKYYPNENSYYPPLDSAPSIRGR